MKSVNTHGDLDPFNNSGSIQNNSYLRNSSVAETAVPKRRNISIGLTSGVNPVDRGGLETA
jgi:hypothetical protein